MKEQKILDISTKVQALAQNWKAFWNKRLIRNIRMTVFFLEYEILLLESPAHLEFLHLPLCFY